MFSTSSSSDEFLLIDQVTKDIIEDVVTVRLLGKDKRLDELARWFGFVGNLADDGDEDVFKRGLTIDVEDADFAIVEIEVSDFFVDCLGKC